MAEWLKAHAWKACVGNRTVGSNPTLSTHSAVSSLYRQRFLSADWSWSPDGNQRTPDLFLTQAEKARLE